VSLPVIMRSEPYSTHYDATDNDNRLGDNAAASTAGSSIVGIDGSGGRGLSLGAIRGDGEESSEEIH
jgi:hypothetical protein